MIDRLSAELTPARRKEIYTLAATVGTVIVGAGMVDQEIVASWLGVFQAALGAAALVLAAIKAQRVDMTAVYAVAAFAVIVLRAAGIITDGVASHWLDLVSTLTAAFGAWLAASRTDTVTPTGEPEDEYRARHYPPPDCATSPAALTPADRYRCAVCAAVYVVPSLARACEARHTQEHP